MEHIGELFGDHLQSLERAAQVYESMQERVSTVMEVAVFCLESGDIDTAKELLTRVKRIVVAACEMGKHAKRRDVELIISVAKAVSVFLPLMERSLSEVADVRDSLDRFVGSSIAYLEEPPEGLPI